jgi:hypothetical protein
MSNLNTICEFKIGTSLAGIRPVTELGIPLPDNWAYDEFSVRAQAGTGAVRGDGFPRAAWQWAVLSREAAFRLFDFAGSAASVAVYIRTPIRAAAGAPFRNYTAYMVLPAASGSEAASLGTQSGAFGEFVVQFLHLESA